VKGEAISVPGLHGTHCAGIIASTDATYRGVAPGVQLLNVKALLSDGRATQQAITTGIDAALDRDAGARAGAGDVERQNVFRQDSLHLC